MTTGKALNGKPYAGNPHVRFDEGEVASAAMPRRGSLLYKIRTMATCATLSLAAFAAPIPPTCDRSAGDFPRLAGEADDSARLQRAVDATPGGVLFAPA